MSENEKGTSKAAKVKPKSSLNSCVVAMCEWYDGEFCTMPIGGSCPCSDAEEEAYE